MFAIFALFLPIIALIALGYALRAWHFLPEVGWSVLEKLVYFLFFPALLFVTLASRAMEWQAGAKMLLVGAGFVGSGILLGILAGFWLKPAPRALASVFQCGFRFNAYIGMTLMATLWGADGIAAFALLAGLTIPLVNVASVWALARHGAMSLPRQLLQNPFILATFAGLGWSALRLPLPESVQTTLMFLGEPALPLGLLATGAGLSVHLTPSQLTLILYFAGVKLLVLPAVALGLGLWLGISGVYLAAAVVMAALPAAASASILASRMGGDGPLVATTVGIGTLLAMFTVPLWVHWL
jgi:malonate transporter